ncbi:MAG: transcriptional repressor [Epulopiscium sp.]|nr:transcriptional repressor [Candidatus Epulonipiscium sp.]
METLTGILKSKNLKVTPQRLAIFSILYNTKSHPSAEDIYKSLQDTNPTMSLATVYKTLDCFKKNDLVQEFNVGEDSFRYDINVGSHPHLICTECHKVSDMDSSILDNIREEVSKETDFKLVNEQLYFYGICPNCQ